MLSDNQTFFLHSRSELPTQQEVLSQLSQLFKLPAGILNGGGRDLALSGQRERPIFADEPNYLLLDQSLPQPLGICPIRFIGNLSSYQRIHNVSFLYKQFNEIITKMKLKDELNVNDVVQTL